MKSAAAEQIDAYIEQLEAEAYQRGWDACAAETAKALAAVKSPVVVIDDRKPAAAPVMQFRRSRDHVAAPGQPPPISPNAIKTWRAFVELADNGIDATPKRVADLAGVAKGNFHFLRATLAERGYIKLVGDGYEVLIRPDDMPASVPRKAEQNPDPPNEDPDFFEIPAVEITEFRRDWNDGMKIAGLCGKYYGNGAQIKALAKRLGLVERHNEKAAT